MDTSAKGLRVLVTAGAAGIGRAIAETFIAHGARVHLCDIDDGGKHISGQAISVCGGMRYIV